MWLWRTPREFSASDFVECCGILHKRSPFVRAQVITRIYLAVNPFSSEKAESRDVLAQLDNLMCHLFQLNDLTLTGQLQGCEPFDVLRSLPQSASIRKLFCEDDALLAAIWGSLSRHRFLEELSGFFDTTKCPTEALPGIFPNLRALDAGAAFAMQLRDPPPTLTQLSVRLDWAIPCATLQALSQVLGHQLRALRIVRWMRFERVLQELKPFPDHPLILCAIMDMPDLRYLYIHDTYDPTVRAPT